MDKQREDFEAWVREYGNYPRRPELKTSDGAYHYLHTESEWRAWQAAQAAQPQRAQLSDAEIEDLRAAQNLKDRLAVMSTLLSEVSAVYTREDDLPDGLLPRIDAALAPVTITSDATKL